MIKVYPNGSKLSYRYNKAGQHIVRTSNNVKEWIFVGNDSRNPVHDFITELVRLDENIDTLGNQCFKSCSKLKKINLADTNVKYLGKECFAECSNLTSVVFSGQISAISEKCFAECNKLTKIQFIEYGGDGKTEKINFKTIEDSAFKNCASLKTLVIPDSITDMSQLNASALAESSITSITFLGISTVNSENENTIKNTRLFGRSDNCEICFSDDSIYKYEFKSNTLTKTGAYQLPNSCRADGKLPVQTKTGIRYKMRLGKPYIFKQSLVEWCRSENTPFIVIYLDHLTDPDSKKFCDEILGNSEFIKKIGKGDTALKCYIFIADRAGNIETGKNPDIDYCRNNFGNKNFISFSFEYQKSSKRISTYPANCDETYKLLTEYSDKCEFGKWQYKQYDVKWDAIEPETIPTNAAETTLINSIGYTPWWR